MEASLFNEETQFVISLISQFLGLDTDRYVTELLKSFFFKVNTSSLELSQSVQLVFFKYDEFLAEIIHSHLVDFHKMRHFRF